MKFRFADLRPGERRDTVVAFLVLFALMAGHALLETARDSLFLARVDASRLPVVYLAIAAVAFAICEGQARLGRWASGRTALAAIIAVGAVVCVLFWVALPHAGRWLLYALYLWSGVVATLFVVRFWLLAADLFHVAQAKRLFPMITTGSILGAIAGSAGAQMIVTSSSSLPLLPAAAVAFGAAAAATLMLGNPRVEKKHAMDPGPSEDLHAEFQSIRAHPYLGRVALLTLLAMVALTTADYAFKSHVAREVSAASLGYVFATTYLVLNTASLAAQLLLVGWVTRHLRVDRLLAIFPIVLGLAGAWLAAAGGLRAALLLKAADGTLRHSLHRTSSEVLYVPLPGDRRPRAKFFIDVAVARGGQAAASLLLLSFAALHAPLPLLGALVVIVCAAWLLVALELRRPYFDNFRATLDEGSIRTRIAFPALDLGSLESLMAALSSPDPREVVAALELHAEKERIRLVPALILYHPSPIVVAKALDLFAADGRTDHVRLVDRLLRHEDATVRVAALLAMPPGSRDAERFEGALADPSPDVRATALVGLLASTDDPHPRVTSILDTLVEAGSAEAKRSLARAIAERPSPKFDDVLTSISSHPDPSVGREAARAMHRAPTSRHIPALFELIARRDVREEARRALLAIGDEALEGCFAALADPSRRVQVRRHLPGTIARFEPERVAQPLLDRLIAEPDGSVRWKILRALGAVRVREPSVRLDSAALDEAIHASLARVCQLVDWRVTLNGHLAANPAWRTPVRDLLVGMLHSKEKQTLERLFRLFSLRYPREDFRRIHRGLQSRDPKARASSRELLETALPSSLRGALATLTDDVPDAQRLRGAGRFLRAQPREPVAAFRAMLEEKSVHLRSLVAYHVSEIGLASLRDDLRRLREEAADSLESSFEHSMARLENPTPESALSVPVR